MRNLQKFFIILGSLCLMWAGLFLAMPPASAEEAITEETVSITAETTSEDATSEDTITETTEGLTSGQILIVFTIAIMGIGMAIVILTSACSSRQRFNFMTNCIEAAQDHVYQQLMNLK